MKKHFILLLLFISLPVFAKSLPEVRLGVLKYGTVNWEIDVIKHHQLDKKYQFELKAVSLASKNASLIALQSHAVDIILSDWLWVNRQRFNDKTFTLFPTSIATGGLFVRADLDIASIHALKNKKIGIAGGAVDKNWLLLQAYSKKRYAFDIHQESQPTFATPPLINRLMLRNDLTAAINFWHYGARLKAEGFELLITVADMLTELGVDTQLPLLGWVFDETWAEQHPKEITGFLKASLKAKQLLLSSDKEWQRIRPLTKAESPEVFEALKKEYRAGILAQFGRKEIEASKQVLKILAEQGGRALVGKAKYLSSGTFWLNNDLNFSLPKQPIE